MKKIVTVTEVAGEGIESLLGERVLIFCMNYIYTGILVGVNQTCVKLEKAKIAFETGDFSKPGYTDAQALPGDSWYVQVSSIESFGLGK